MDKVKITVKRPFDLTLDPRGEPLRFPCSIINGDVVPKEYEIEETLIDHWFIKSLIDEGLVVVNKQEAAEDKGPDELESLNKTRLVELIREIDPDFNPGKSTKPELVEIYKGLVPPKDEGTEGEDAGANDTKGAPEEKTE